MEDTVDNADQPNPEIVELTNSDFWKSGVFGLVFGMVIALLSYVCWPLVKFLIFLRVLKAMSSCCTICADDEESGNQNRRRRKGKSYSDGDQIILKFAIATGMFVGVVIGGILISEFDLRWAPKAAYRYGNVEIIQDENMNDHIDFMEFTHYGDGSRVISDSDHTPDGSSYIIDAVWPQANAKKRPSEEIVVFGNAMKRQSL